MNLASYFKPLVLFEVEKFDVLTSKSCIPVAIAKDLLHPSRKDYIIGLMSRMEFTELVLLH